MAHVKVSGQAASSASEPSLPLLQAQSQGELLGCAGLPRPPKYPLRRPHAYAYLYVYSHAYVYILHMQIYTYIHIYICTTHVYAYTNMYTYIHRDIYIHRNICIIYVRVNIYMYIHINTIPVLCRSSSQGLDIFSGLDIFRGPKAHVHMRCCF